MANGIAVKRWSLPAEHVGHKTWSRFSGLALLVHLSQELMGETVRATQPEVELHRRSLNTSLSQQIRGAIVERTGQLAAEAGIAVVAVPAANTWKHRPRCLVPLRQCLPVAVFAEPCGPRLDRLTLPIGKQPSQVDLPTSRSERRNLPRSFRRSPQNGPKAVYGPV